MMILRPLYYFVTLGLLQMVMAVPGVLGATQGPKDPVRGADELFWSPTLEQSLQMAEVTGKPIFIMGYSLVGDGSTYTKSGPDYCTGVF